MHYPLNKFAMGQPALFLSPMLVIDAAVFGLVIAVTPGIAVQVANWVEGSRNDGRESLPA